jgi:hypothetical protein
VRSLVCFFGIAEKFGFAKGFICEDQNILRISAEVIYYIINCVKSCKNKALVVSDTLERSVFISSSVPLPPFLSVLLFSSYSF